MGRYQAKNPQDEQTGASEEMLAEYDRLLVEAEAGLTALSAG
jgi:hypothetical protein